MAQKKVFIGVFYDTVVITNASTRADATKALRSALIPRHRREASSISLLNHVALVYWSATRGSFWYRLPSTDDACAIRAERVPNELRGGVPVREPDRPKWTPA